MLSALYYPFSRCINTNSLKQMLLIFDDITLLDPVEDEDWRAHLYKNLEINYDNQFSKYREIRKQQNVLEQEKIILHKRPKELTTIFESTTTLSTISDLLDTDWVKIAKEPQKFSLPYQTFKDKKSPVWHIFKTKIPDDFLNVLHDEEELRAHLLQAGNDNYSWIFSYAAGSALSLNIHLAAAEELSLAPVSDSLLHHQLLMKKLLRNEYEDEKTATPLTEKTIDFIARNTAIQLVKELLPNHILEETSYDDILKFREKTKKLRQDLINDLTSEFKILSTIPSVKNITFQQTILVEKLKDKLEAYQNDLSVARSKIWSSIPTTLNSSLVPSGLAAISLNYLGSSPGFVVVASIVAGAIGLLKSAIDINVEKEKMRKSASPTITYLSTLIKNIK